MGGNWHFYWLHMSLLCIVMLALSKLITANLVFLHAIRDRVAVADGG